MHGNLEKCPFFLKNMYVSVDLMFIQNHKMINIQCNLINAKCLQINTNIQIIWFVCSTLNSLKCPTNIHSNDLICFELSWNQNDHSNVLN